MQQKLMFRERESGREREDTRVCIIVLPTTIVSELILGFSFTLTLTLTATLTFSLKQDILRLLTVFIPRLLFSRQLSSHPLSILEKSFHTVSRC